MAVFCSHKPKMWGVALFWGGAGLSIHSHQFVSLGSCVFLFCHVNPKVLADQTVWGLYLNAMYSFIIGVLAGRPLGDVWRDVKSTAWPALRTSWRFWPFVHTVSFSHAVPLDLKLLWVDAMEVAWVTLLSKVANDDKEALLSDDTAPMCILADDNADPATEVRCPALVLKQRARVLWGRKPSVAGGERGD